MFRSRFTIQPGNTVLAWPVALVCALCLTPFGVAEAALSAKLHAIIKVVVENRLTDEFPDPSIGQEICRAAGGTSCVLVDSIGEGICRAGDGGRMCSYVDSIGEGLCKAKGGNFCSTMSAERALALPLTDTDWAWDRFRAPNSFDRIWACRGTSTGEFAEDFRCFGKLKTDSTWPNN
jgi:hypothetical protein